MMTDEEKQFIALHLDTIVSRAGGDNRTRKWVQIRNSIMDYYASRELAQTSQLRAQVKQLQEGARQTSLF
jgi:hypothetical protein